MKNLSNAVLVADLRRAIAGIEPHAVAGFGPVVGFAYRHAAGNFRNFGTSKLEVGQTGIITQGFAASVSWLPVGEVPLLAGRNFSRHHPDPREILIDAEVAPVRCAGLGASSPASSAVPQSRCHNAIGS